MNSRNTDTGSVCTVPDVGTDVVVDAPKGIEIAALVDRVVASVVGVADTVVILVDSRGNVADEADTGEVVDVTVVEKTVLRRV